MTVARIMARREHMTMKQMNIYRYIEYYCNNQ